MDVRQNCVLQNARLTWNHPRHGSLQNKRAAELSGGAFTQCFPVRNFSYASASGILPIERQDTDACPQAATPGFSVRREVSKASPVPSLPGDSPAVKPGLCSGLPRCAPQCPTRDFLYPAAGWTMSSGEVPQILRALFGSVPGTFELFPYMRPRFDLTTQNPPFSHTIVEMWKDV